MLNCETSKSTWSKYVHFILIELETHFQFFSNILWQQKIHSFNELIRTHFDFQVGNGELPLNHQIVYQLQDILNLLPDVTTDNFTETMYVKTNDQMLVVYLASMVRSIIALHDLINNKLTNRDAEEGKKLKKEEKE